METASSITVNNYIGQTTTTLSRRFTMHLASGGTKQHTFDTIKLYLEP